MTGPRQNEDVVIRQFEEQIDLYKSRDTSDCPIVPFIKQWISSLDGSNRSDSVKICEFGGGGGNLLQEFDALLGEQVKLFNVELVESYREYQASKRIRFIKSSILHKDFPDRHFDVVFIRDVLHHLIGESFNKTRDNQAHAIANLWRMLKPKGLMIIHEETNQSRLACWLVFHLSRMASRLKKRNRLFEITPNTIVCFLTHGQILKMGTRITGERSILLRNDYKKCFLGIQFMITLLMSRVGDSFLVFQKSTIDSG